MSYGQEEQLMFNTSECSETGATSEEMIRRLENLNLVQMKEYLLGTHPQERPTSVTT